MLTAIMIMMEPMLVLLLKMTMTVMVGVVMVIKIAVVTESDLRQSLLQRGTTMVTRRVIHQA